MINISSASKLDIVLPNTNKALAQVLRDATPKELEAITKGKDLKSIMNSILKQSASNSSADKELLNLVKNNPTLKNLGDVQTSIKDLLNSIKSEKNPLPIEKVLNNLLTNIKDMNAGELKQKLENSGVFLESRLKNATNPQTDLKNTLTTLAKNLEQAPSTASRAILSEVKVLLNSEPLKSASNADIPKNLSSKDLASLASNVDKIVQKLSSAIKGADTTQSPILSKTLEKLQHQLTPTALSNENFKLSSVKESLEIISQQMSKSFTMESKGILNALEKIMQAIKSIDTSGSILEQFNSKNIAKEIDKLTQNINQLIQKGNPLSSKESLLIFNKLEHLNTAQQLNPQNNIKEIISNDLKAVLLQTSEELTKNPHAKSAEILKQMDKLALQIDHYQLLSHLSNASSLYVPYSWDMLEDGSVEMKKDEQNRFYCDIDLKLKEYGELNLKLTLYEKNQLNLHIYSSSEEFKSMMKENIPSLRSALIEAQVTPREIRIFEPKPQKPSSPYENSGENIYMGFEVKA